MSLEQIISNMPDNLDDLEKARYIYIELGKILEFDTTTMFNSNSKYYYKNHYYKNININNCSNKVTCTNWCDIYIKLLNKVGIKALKHSEHKSHAWVVIELDKKIYADATLGAASDLARIKSGIKPINFAPLDPNKNDCLKLSTYDKDFSDKIDSIDEKLGYKLERENAHDALINLKNEVSNLPDTIAKVNYIFAHIDLSDFGFYEGKEYIRYVFDLVGINNVMTFNMSKTEPNLDVTIIRCFVIEGNYYIYYPKKNIELINFNDFKKLVKAGFGVTSSIMVNGIFLERFKIYDFSKKGKLRLKKENLFTKYYKEEFKFLK